jgi:hypothetical protein
MKFYNVFSRRDFTAKGETQTKTRWMKVGEIKVTDRGGKFLKLYHLPDTDFSILPDINDTSEDMLIID